MAWAAGAGDHVGPEPAGHFLEAALEDADSGEGCSSPIVCDGRVYLTTAYEGAQRHAWDEPAFWGTILLSACVIGMALLRTPSVRRISPEGLALGAWTLAVVALTVLVLAKPRWFWQFADPWTGTTVAPAELAWVESLNVRPMIVLACGSLVLIWIGSQGSGGRGQESEAGRLTPDSRLLTLGVTLACGVALGLIGWRPEWFFEASQPWLAWLVTGGLGLFAFGASIGWLGGWTKIRLLLAGAGFLLAGWLFLNVPDDEFGSPLAWQNRIVYLIPGLVLLLFHAWANRPAWGKPRPPTATPRPLLSPLVPLLPLALLVFVRAKLFAAASRAWCGRSFAWMRHSGEVLWNTPVYVAAAEKRHSLNSLATPTPACDGERVYAYFGSGLAALDKNGQLLWLKRDADFAGFIRYGAGSSVVLAGDNIIIYRDSEFMGHGDHLDDDIQSQTARRPSALTAYDKATGAEAWSITPPFSHDSYMTPLVWNRDGQLEVVDRHLEDAGGLLGRRWLLALDASLSHAADRAKPGGQRRLLVRHGRQRPALADRGGAGAGSERHGAGANDLVQSRDGEQHRFAGLLEWAAFLDVARRRLDLPGCRQRRDSLEESARAAAASPRSSPATARSTRWIRRGRCTSSPPTPPARCWRPMPLGNPARPRRRSRGTCSSCALPAISTASAAANSLDMGDGRITFTSPTPQGKEPSMTISPLAGKPAPKEMLVDLARLEKEYFERRPDMSDPNQLVSFGTSGHRGTPFNGTFTEAHILAITQAICDYRRGAGTDGPLYMGKDTHALSAPAQRTALEVLSANSVETIIQQDDGVTPTPVISRAILVYNRGRKEHLADGIVITPSHNPPEDGGFKYNPTNGGPADTDVTRWVQDRANELLRGGNQGVKRVPFVSRHQGRVHAPGRFRPAVRQRSAQRHRHGGDPRRRAEAGGRSARRGSGALLGANQRNLRLEH